MISRTDLHRFLESHRAAAARLREEMLRKLPALSIEQARVEYDSLCRVWETSRLADAVGALDRAAIEERIALRRRLAGRRCTSWPPSASGLRCGGVRGHESRVRLHPQRLPHRGNYIQIQRPIRI